MLVYKALKGPLIVNSQFKKVNKIKVSIDLTVMVRADFFAKDVKNRLLGHTSYSDLENSLETPPKIRFRIFRCYVRKAKIKFNSTETVRK